MDGNADGCEEGGQGSIGTNASGEPAETVTGETELGGGTEGNVEVSGTSQKESSSARVDGQGSPLNEDVGEGSMVYGAGHYVTNVESTGRMYADIVTNRARTRYAEKTY